VVPPRYIPTKKASNGGGTYTVNTGTYEYDVANVVLDNWVGNVAQSVALGNIVPQPGEGIQRNKWVLR